MRGFLAALRFLTLFPGGGRIAPEDLERAPAWFPGIGLLLGAAAAAADALGAAAGLPGFLRALAAVALLAAASGGLHLDGLADTADGFCGVRDRRQVLAVMQDSRIGTMGVLALFFVLAFKVASLQAMEPTLRWRALLFAPLAGRCLMVLTLHRLPYAREEGGMATVFHGRPQRQAAAVAATLFALSSLALFGPGSGMFLVALPAGGAWLLSRWSRRRIGGATGDTLGATSEVAETLALLAVGCLGATSGG